MVFDVLRKYYVHVSHVYMHLVFMDISVPEVETLITMSIRPELNQTTGLIYIFSFIPVRDFEQNSSSKLASSSWCMSGSWMPCV